MVEAGASGPSWMGQGGGWPGAAGGWNFSRVPAAGGADPLPPTAGSLVARGLRGQCLIAVNPKMEGYGREAREGARRKGRQRGDTEEDKGVKRTWRGGGERERWAGTPMSWIGFRQRAGDLRPARRKPASRPPQAQVQKSVWSDSRSWNPSERDPRGFGLCLVKPTERSREGLQERSRPVWRWKSGVRPPVSAAAQWQRLKHLLEVLLSLESC